MGMKKMSNTSKLSKINEPVQILRKIQTAARDSIIAGGYFRDRFNEVPFNDIDIYIKEPSADDTQFGDGRFLNDEFWKAFFKLRTGDWRSMDDINDTDEEYDVKNNRNIITIFEMMKNKLKYNLIIIDIDPIEYVTKMFDFNICRAYCDGKKITYTKEFMSDIEHNTITFSDRKSSNSNFGHAMHIHLPKLQSKYPNHTLVIPEIHQEKYRNYKKQFI